MKMKKSEWKAALILIIVSFCIVAGCIAQKTEGPVILRTSMSLTKEEWKVMREDIFPEFERANNCKIEAYEIKPAELHMKLEEMEKTGEMKVDVFAQDNMMLAILVEKGLVEDLSGYKNKIPEEVIEALITACEFNGKLYFMPYRPNVQITYYNEKKFREYGLELPKNWDDLLNVAKVFKEREGVGRIGIKAVASAPTTCQIYEWIVSAGGDPLSFNDEGCVKTFEFLQELWPYCSPESKTAKWDTTNDFLANDIFYIAQNWPFGIPIIVKDYGKSEIKAYHGWAGPVKEAHVIGGEVMGIPVGSQNKELALKFIEYMQSKKVQEILVSKLAWPSIRTDALEEVEDWLVPYFQSITEAMSHGVFRENVPYWTDFDKLFNEVFVKIVIEGQDVKKVLDEYHEKMENMKAQY